MKEKLIPERLTKAREALGLSLPEAARKTGIDKAAFWRYEQGIMGPSETALRILAIYLDTSVPYLTGKTEDPAPDMFQISANRKQDVLRFLSLFDKLTERQQKLVEMIIEELAGK